MQISTKQLRIQPGRIISHVSNGQEVTVTYRGKPSAKIIPINTGSKVALEDTKDELFGIWKNREDMDNVEQYIRNKRKGRKIC
jgi:prevent-host-death family protein